MVLVLTDDQIRGLVTMNEYIQAMERAYREYGDGRAAIRPRQRYQVIAPAGHSHVTASASCGPRTPCAST